MKTKVNALLVGSLLMSSVSALASDFMVRARATV